jgi:ABC-type lipoprotein release transport system permease subunit
MKFLLIVSLRNLLRQKRRNVLLGSAMAFGVMILITAGAFSRGITDIMFNKIVVYVSGVSIRVNEGRGRELSIFRDRERLIKIIKDRAGAPLSDHEEAIGIFSRALGNGKAENMMLVGIDTSRKITEEQRKEYEESFHMVEGRFEDLGSAAVENPMILSREKADALNVKKNDIVRIRFKDVRGQTQSARLTVTGIMSNDNIFMSGVMFIEMLNLKKMMSYRPYECGSIFLTIKDPQKNARDVADRIHGALKPGPAFIYAEASAGGKRAATTILPFMGNDEQNKKIIARSFRLSAGKMESVTSSEGMMISSRLARELGANVGTKIEFSFKPRFETDKSRFTAKVKGIFIPDKNTGADTVYMQEALFYPKFYENLPDLPKDIKKAFIPADSVPFRQALGNEWVLLDRSKTTDDVKKKIREIARRKVKAATVDVNSMYESASDVLKLEDVLKLITFVAVLVLFIIILIGVLNTLRMTIRERTREIGTIRAIGMQKRDVGAIFILETLFLTFFSSIAGTILAFIAMALLSLMQFQVTDNPMGILLVKQHLHFVPTAAGVAENIIFIIIIAVATAFFPARKAANLSAAEALRHFE